MMRIPRVTLMAAATLTLATAGAPLGCEQQPPEPPQRQPTPAYPDQSQDGEQPNQPNQPANPNPPESY